MESRSFRVAAEPEEDETRVLDLVEAVVVMTLEV
jgi:hypothetical protein